MVGFACLLFITVLGADGPPADRGPGVGDVIFSISENRMQNLLYRVALVGLPSHAGIVVRMPGGELGVLEAGGGGILRTRTTPLEVRLDRPGDREILIRRRAAPLSEEQARRLNEFAALSEDTGYSKRRALALAWFSPRGPRGPIRTCFDGQPKGLRDDFVCSEVIVEALVYAGIIDAATARPSATTPRDLMLDRSRNFYIDRHPPLACGWLPPVRWISDPTPKCRVSAESKRGLLRFAR